MVLLTGEIFCYYFLRELKGLITFDRHIHRADLHRGLLECATDYGCKLYLDNRVVKIDPYKPSLETISGKVFTGDLIVASDGKFTLKNHKPVPLTKNTGLNSMARSVVYGQPSFPTPTGQMVYRVTLPVKKLEGIPELEELITVPRNNHWIGPRGTILSYLLEGIDETLINFVFTYVLSLLS